MGCPTKRPPVLYSLSFVHVHFAPKHIKGEMKIGLGGYLFIQCSHCGSMKRVAYGSTYIDHKRRGQHGQRNFTVNTKLWVSTF